MGAISKRVVERLVAGIKRYQPILADAKARDVGEADTVTIIKDMLADVFGYDKYSEVTSEHSVRGTYCDLALKIDGALQTLIEVKAIGLTLKDGHIKQAVDYAANQGVDWVLLTNGVCWRVYQVVRRELRRVSPDVRIEVEQLKEVLANEVIKREVMEGDKAQEARKTIARTATKTLRAAANYPTPPTESEVPEK